MTVQQLLETTEDELRVVRAMCREREGRVKELESALSASLMENEKDELALHGQWQRIRELEGLIQEIHEKTGQP